MPYMDQALPITTVQVIIIAALTEEQLWMNASESIVNSLTNKTVKWPDKFENLLLNAARFLKCV